LDIELQPQKVSRFLLVLVAGFTLAHIAGQYVEIHLGHTYGLFLFNLEREQSIPRFYSAVMLLSCSGLLLIIAISKKGIYSPGFRYWLGLVFVFLCLAIIKITSIHEYLAVAFQSVLNITRFQFYAWSYGILLVIFPMVYLKFLLSLPRETKFLMIIAGFIFIAGAFGLDLIGKYFGNSINHHTIAYISLATLEEVLEMVGIIVFMYSLLSYISLEFKWIRVGITKKWM
jgi:hypothetical protein